MNETINNIIFYKVGENISITDGIVDCLFEQKLSAVIIEGGATTIQYFIDANLWDEAMIITNKNLQLKTGISSPKIKMDVLLNTENFFTDCIDFYKQNDNEFL
jgi:diaminohydroxyphosphoribosylaminopyrimidine deaminase/5-amino-6-(5-phosphoribosylamino)uracil reductase